MFHAMMIHHVTIHRAQRHSYRPLIMMSHAMMIHHITIHWTGRDFYNLYWSDDGCCLCLFPIHVSTQFCKALVLQSFKPLHVHPALSPLHSRHCRSRAEITVMKENKIRVYLFPILSPLCMATHVLEYHGHMCIQMPGGPLNVRQSSDL